MKMNCNDGKERKRELWDDDEVRQVNNTSHHLQIDFYFFVRFSNFLSVKKTLQLC